MSAVQLDGRRHELNDAVVARPTIKAALFVGFGLICAIWLIAGYYLTRRMADAEHRSAAINERYTRAQELLATARSQVLLGSVYVRDALLDPNPASSREYRAKLDAAYRVADQALAQYVPVLDALTERERIGRLQAEVDDFRTTVAEVLATDSRHWAADAPTLLRRRIMPKREAAVRVTEEMQALNRAAFVQQQSEIAAIYRTTHRRLWESFGLAVLASLVVGIVAIVYVGQLENRLERQRVRERATARDLQRLSSQLITAQEEERRTIARELHDEVGQALTALKVELALAERAVAVDGRPTQALDDARAIADSTLHTIRDLSHLLHPAMLDDLGLAAAADEFLKRLGRRHGIRVELLTDRMDRRLNPETEAAAYRIIQEAVTNVVKHADAKSCRVYLQRLTNTLLVTIEDDGCGFDPATPAADHGLGLIGIRERATQLQGTVRIESAPGNGTRLTVELPATVRAAGDDATAAPCVRLATSEVARG